MDGYGYRPLVDSVSLLTPELLAEVGRMVVERGHRVAGKKSGAALRGRRHSFVVGTDVHHPTDRSLLMDAARCMVRDVSRACHYQIPDRLIPFSAPSGPVWPWHGFPRR